MSLLEKYRVAIIHDWLPLYGGAERVLEQIITLIPHADIFSLIESLPGDQRGFLQGKSVRTSFVQRLPGGKKHYRHFFPLMPFAIEQFDLSSYEIIISSSYSFAKGVITGPEQLHLCYCHSPVRYAWDLQHQYFAQIASRFGVRTTIARMLMHYIRMWDSRTANGVDAFASNSRYVSRRIRKVYQRDATVIYPPVSTEWFELTPAKADYYVTACRMVPYKRVDVVVDAFRDLPERRLLVIGDGPDFARLRAAAPPNVEFLGYTPLPKLIDYLQQARAFIFAAEEDFGIVTVEAQACGTPVIAFGQGGSAETVIDGETGVLFPEQTPASLVAAVERFETLEFDHALIRRHAETFSSEQFRKNFSRWIEHECVRSERRGPQLPTLPIPVPSPVA